MNVIQLGSITQILFVVFLIICLGYILGRITLKGIALHTSGVFIAALAVGAIGNEFTHSLLAIDMPKIIQNLGLVFFVTSVGYIAGKGFFSNLRTYLKSYIIIGAICILSGTLCCILFICFGKVDSSLAVGMLSGALTSTPGYSAAQEVVSYSEELTKNVAVGHGVTYPFGVMAVVIFIQIVPKIVKCDMDIERSLLHTQTCGKHEQNVVQKGKIQFDSFGFTQFAATILLGMLLGAITIPLPGSSSFSLGNTGGPLLAGLIVGGFNSIGNIDIRCKQSFLSVVREIGLVLFLVGSGYEGGSSFAEVVSEYGPVIILYGAVMTIVPMLLSYIVAKRILKLSLLNNLGAITGGMTSTPALGALVNVAGTESVSNAYASTYPVALVLVVLACQLIVTFL